MVLYLLTKLGILKPRSNFNWCTRFDLSFWHTSQQIYRKLQYKEKLLEEFQDWSHFLRKIVLYYSTNLVIINSWTNIPSLRRSAFCFWQTWKETYTKLQNRQKAFWEFQGLSGSPRKTVSYLSTKFGILKPWTVKKKFITNSNIERKFLRVQYNFNIRRKFLESSKICLAL